MSVKTILGAFLALLINTQVFAQVAFVEGTHFVSINPPVATSNPDKVVVTELFWYGCPHCYRLEPRVRAWAPGLPDGVVFEQIPSIVSPRWANHARAFYTLQMMEKQELLHDKIYDALHVERRRLNSVDEIVGFVSEQGVDEKAFRDTWNSFPVDAQLRKNFSKEKKYGHDGVPALIVNGKYRTSAAMAGDNQRLLEVVEFLVQRELRQ